MRVCVIDGQGGGLGSRLIAGLQADLRQGDELIGLATNHIAAEAMSQAGAKSIAIGPEAITDTVRTADIIVTSLNVLLTYSHPAEVTTRMIQSILESRGTKIVLPINRFGMEVAGTQSSKLEQLISNSLFRVRTVLHS